MDVKTIKHRRKGYTEAFGYCSCRTDDFDWLIKQAEIAELPQKLWETIFFALWNERARWERRKLSAERTSTIKRLTIAIDKIRPFYDGRIKPMLAENS